jgi:hypothetical protein
VTNHASWSFTAELWRWRAREGEAGEGAWYFVTVPEEPSDDIHDLMDGRTKGFGSVRVRVRVGGTAWETSVFPDSSTGCFVLPVKKAVRVAEGVGEGDDVAVTLTLRDDT